jgi:uncharacterized RDD family membrane protein YckC
MYSYPTTSTGDGRIHRPSSAGPSRDTPWPRGTLGNVKLASWGWRMASGAIDYVPLWILLVLFSAMQLATLGHYLVVAALGVNSIYMQGKTGQSLGKRIVGTQVARPVKEPGGSLVLAYPGVWRCLFRQFGHFIDYIVLLTGYLRPLWQRRYRTWADSIAKTVVISRDCEVQLEVASSGSESLRDI